ncbi:PLDc N-terminal domain-containing protein [Jeotgalicoccus halotolerans]|uniref:Phospholipase D-like protein n=1 Tax=Jeotgalicoccus halotolerans TaxID=157227 RepID=A0A3E0AXA6_9STAP|nr:PLDc N-terminal domain-containing protein [Jeotgalicoccus halotolerans]REG24339.1 phospholipase D-like protein [Jeotgalicoccus halotolerans]
MIINVKELLPFLIPLMILQLLLMISALTMIIQQRRFKYLNRAAWIIIVIVFNIVGPVLYFVMERK